MSEKETNQGQFTHASQKNSPNNQNHATETSDKNRQSTVFEAAEDNVLDRSKRDLGKKSWFQRLFG
ncbi:hypothetical protein [Candidatus Formimonas warabiya]|uniref:Uncharacterized protein n=1 Tax=Formimonas warabiya TaxID=1761012 RepID=A0A3G1KNA3_FORW1|nr:hypothetical protein [Candidatus Formimonas warabiya]ATW23900.1 hypothetical protein DCMF_03005 [Candidatus Formimonas warabiya]